MRLARGAGADGRQRVVVVGAGFAGIGVARALERRFGDALELVVLDRRNSFVFTPLLAEVATGTVNEQHAVVPLRQFFERARPLRAEVVGIDVDGRSLAFRPDPDGSPRELELAYDQLVLAPGSVTSFFGVEGARERSHTLDSVADAIALRNALVDRLERAEVEPEHEERAGLLTFVVAGGSFTGVELAGGLADYAFFAEREYPRVRREELRVVVVEMQDRLLPDLPPELGERARAALEAKGVEVRLGAAVEEVGETDVLVAGGERIASWTVVWAAGVEPAPLVGGLPLERDERGRAVAEPTLQAAGRDDVWLAGDGAAIPDGSGGLYPPTAQHALRQGAHIADGIARRLRGEQPTAFSYDSPGMMIVLGHRDALAYVYGRTLGGLPAWLMWSGYYLSRMPKASRRARVASDWLLSALAGPSLVALPLYARLDPRFPRAAEHGIDAPLTRERGSSD